MADNKPTLVKPLEEVVPIAKPSAFDLEKFKSKRAAAIANVETLQTGLPHHSISQAKDFVRLHSNEERYWSPELCFVSVPDQGAEARDTAPDRGRFGDAVSAERTDSAFPLGTREQALRPVLPLPRADTGTWTTSGTKTT